MWKIIKFTEPEFLQKILVTTNNFVSKNLFLQQLLPITADIFVFFYPIFLVILYLKGEFSNQKKFQIYALNIFSSTIFAVIFNYIIKFFVEKIRPDQVLNLPYFRNKLIFEDIPKSTFPSDHMAVSSAIAFSVYLIRKQEKTKSWKILTITLRIFVLIMMISRFAIGLHWITDLIAGIFVGIISGYLVNLSKIQKILNKIYKILLKISNFIFLPIKNVRKTKG